MLYLPGKVTLTYRSVALQQLQMKAFFAITVLSISSFVAAQVTCTPGYYNSGAAGCKKCPLGTYQPSEGRTGCKPCTDGYVSMAMGSIECVPCGPNQEPTQFKDSCKCVLGAVPDASGRCKLCKPGEYMFERPSGRRRCLVCGSKEFQPEAGKTMCLPCAEGQVSSSDRTACLKCGEGEVLLDGKCGKCPPGQFLDHDSCVECEKDSFKAKEGNGPCTSCPGNSFSMAGARKCVTCAAGKALMKNGRCGSCPPGSYFDYDRSCKKCNKGSFMPDENLRSECFYCAGNTNSLKGAVMCTKCDSDEVLMKDGTCGVCPPGSGYESFSMKCTTCGFNRYSKGRGIDQTCADCGPFEYAPKGASDCISCPDGQALIISRKNNKGECKACRTGSYYDQYKAKCIDCGERSVSPGGSRRYDGCKFCDTHTEPNADRTACV